MGRPRAFLRTKRSVADLMAFYRREMTRRGLREDAAQSGEQGRDTFLLVFTGLAGGYKVIIRCTELDQMAERFLLLAIEPSR